MALGNYYPRLAFGNMYFVGKIITIKVAFLDHMHLCILSNTTIYCVFNIYVVRWEHLKSRYDKKSHLKIGSLFPFRICYIGHSNRLLNW